MVMLRLFLVLCLMSGPALAQSATDRATVLVLDSSGSMWAQLPEGRSRVEVARDVLDDFLRTRQSMDPLGVVAYGNNRRGDCADLSVIAPLGPQDGATLGARLRALTPRGKTPIADALRLAASQVPPTAEEADIVLITDGLETCGGDPCAVAAELAALGVPLRAHVVGFGLTEGEIRQIACVAEQTGGQVLATTSGAELAEALVRTTAPAPAAPEAPGEASLNLTIRADIAGRPDRVAFRAVAEAGGAPRELGTLDFSQSAVLPVTLAEGSWLITADAGALGHGEIDVRIEAGDTRTIYVPFRGLLPSVVMAPPLGARRAGASGLFPYRITDAGIAEGGADFQLTLLPADASDLNDRRVTWSYRDGSVGADSGQLNLPDAPGTYLVAFHRTGETDLDRALALVTVRVETRPDVSLNAPEAVEPGAAIPVTVAGGMANADRIEVWKDGQLYSWDQSFYMEQTIDTVYGPATPLRAPAEPGAYELVYVFSGIDGPEAVAARQPLQVGPVDLDDASAPISQEPMQQQTARCDDDSGCAMGEDAPQPGSGVVSVRILADGAQGAAVEWFAQPIGQPDGQAVASGGAIAGPWETALDEGAWALTGIADDATYFGQVEVSEGGTSDLLVARDGPLPDDAPEAGAGAATAGAAMAFLCDSPVQCVFEDAEVGILAVLPAGWAVDGPTREAATAGGDGGPVRMTIFDAQRPNDALILNPHQWIEMNGPCIDVQPGQLCHFEPAGAELLAALDMVRRSIRDTAPRRSPSPQDALRQIVRDVAEQDPEAAAAIEDLLGAAQGAEGGPDIGGILGGLLGGGANTGKGQ